MPALLPSQAVQYLRTEQGAVPEQTLITCLADAGAYEVCTVTCPAFASITQADYFSFQNKAGTTFAVWFDKDANGTPPSGAIYTAATHKIKASISTGNTAVQVAAAAVTAIGAQFTNVTVLDNLDGTIRFTQTKIGTCVDAAPHSANDGAAGSLSVSVSTQGAASTLQNKYFQLQQGNGTTNRYVWMNVGAEGVDPSGTGTQLAVALSAGGSATANATALAAALNSDGAFVAEASGANVHVVCAVSGNALNAADSNSGFTIAVTAQGYDAEENTPYGNIAASSPTPSAKVATS